MEYWTIKEASKKLGVEAHVLRYWEEELGLSIKRNEMGHRYYDSRNMEMFDEIQKLKEQGFTLKDIRAAIEKYQQQKDLGVKGVESNSESKDQEVEGTELKHEKMNRQPRLQETTPQVVEFKTAQLQSIMNRVVANALRENKDIIKESVKGEVVKDVLHQLDLVMRENEEREDERFRRLDESLRKLQQANEEVAATRVKKCRWRKR